MTGRNAELRNHLRSFTVTVLDSLAGPSKILVGTNTVKPSAIDRKPKKVKEMNRPGQKAESQPSSGTQVEGTTPVWVPHF